MRTEWNEIARCRLTKEQQFFFRVQVAQVRLHVQELHFEAVRIGCVFAEAWALSCDRELLKFADRIDRELISEFPGNTGVAGGHKPPSGGVLNAPATTLCGDGVRGAASLSVHPSMHRRD